jgi:hypothetical protein
MYPVSLYYSIEHWQPPLLRLGTSDTQRDLYLWAQIAYGSIIRLHRRIRYLQCTLMYLDVPLLALKDSMVSWKGGSKCSILYHFGTASIGPAVER